MALRLEQSWKIPKNGWSMQTKTRAANAVSDYDTQIEELKQSQIGVYYEEQFDRAAEKVDRFRDKLDGLKSLISDDMKIDKNTGLLTESGALSITLDVDDINASTENLKTYIKERQQIINVTTQENSARMNITRNSKM